MPISTFGADLSAESPSVSLRISGVEIGVCKGYSVNSHWLTPTSSFRFEVGDEVLSDEVHDLLVPGSKVELFIDGSKQLAGYLLKYSTVTDRAGGTTIMIEGQDSLWPVCTSQVDPDHHYPDKIPLSKLLEDLLTPFGFKNFLVDDEDDIDVSANRARKIHAGAKKHRRTRRASRKALPQYKLPKRKPEHNDTYFMFLSRILNRQGLWLRASIDGESIICGKPDYDQDPLGTLTRRKDGVGNNILHGGVEIDASEQPSFIKARGSIPGREVKHMKTTVVIGNPYDDVVGRVLETRDNPNSLASQAQSLSGSLLERRANNTFDRPLDPTLSGSLLEKRKLKALPPPPVDDFVARLLGAESRVDPNSSLTAAGEPGTLNTFAERRKVETKVDHVTIIQAPPVLIDNPYASTVPIVRFCKDKSSHTIEELTNYAKRQMSLCARRAFVYKATIEGHVLGDVIPQVNTILHITDEFTRVKGKTMDAKMWVLGRTFSQSRSGGTTTTLELLPPGCIFL